MKLIKEIARYFSQSNYFSPLGANFIEIVKIYIEESRISIEHLAEEIKSFEEIEGYSIDLHNEEQILTIVIPKIVSRVEGMIETGEVDDGTVDKHTGYDELLSFPNKYFLAGLIDVLSEIGQCSKLYEMLEEAKPIQVPSALEGFYSVKDDLIDVSQFEVLPKGFALKKHNLVVYPKMPFQLNLQVLSFFTENKGMSYLKIRPSHFGKYSAYSDIQRLQEARIFGMPFSKQNLQELIGKEYGVLQYSHESDVEERISIVFHFPLKELQYVIKPTSDGYVTISIEEVIDIEKEHYHKYSFFSYLCDDVFFMLHRYAHAIIDQETLEIIHFDLSYMYYDFDAYSERITAHMKDKVVSATIKKKLFRIDGTIPFDSFKKILAACFDSNPEIVNLLKGS